MGGAENTRRGGFENPTGLAEIKNKKPYCWGLSLCVTILLALANLAAFSWFLNFHPNYYLNGDSMECWASAYGDYEDTVAYDSWENCAYRDNCVNVTWDNRSVMVAGIIISIWWLLFPSMPYCVKACSKNIHCCDCLSYTISFMFLISVTVYRFRWAG